MIKAIKLKKIVIFVIIFIIIFGIFYYKNFLFGNNISKNRTENKIENILNNLTHYNAQINVTVNSNKTQNSYVIYQEVRENYSMQEIKEGEGIKGVKIELDNQKLKISNTKLNLEKVYEKYNNLLNNAIFLNTFAEDYKNSENDTKYTQENENLILEIKLNNSQNTYIQYKKMYVNSKTLLPTKLEIKDNTKKETICIIYNNIEIN